MSNNVGSTVPRRRLGRELRRLRHDAHRKSEEVADLLDWSRSKVWRIETGQVPISRTDLMALIGLYHPSPELVDVLYALAAESKNKGWWQSFGDTFPEWFDFYVGLETAASEFRWYTVEVVPGLFQTPEYARILFETERDRRDIDRKIELRIKRQALLIREMPESPQLDVILNEAVIRRVAGSPRIMAAQLQRLLDISEAPNVELRVLPFSAGLHSCMMTPYTILSFPDRQDPDVVYLETATGALYLEKPKELAQYGARFGDLRQKSLDRHRSRDLMVTVMKEYRT